MSSFKKLLILLCLSLLIEQAAQAQSWIVLSKMNFLGVTSPTAHAGKIKLANAIKNEKQWLVIKKFLIENPKSRAITLEHFSDIDGTIIDELLNNSTFRPKFFSNQYFSKFLTYAKNLQRYTHIFNGDEMGGWHYKKTGRPGNKILNEVKGKNGVYKRDVQIMINGQLQESKMSTFFPDNWSEEKVLEVINKAYDNRKFRTDPNTYYANVEDIDIEMYIDSNTNKLTSIFPSLKNFNP